MPVERKAMHDRKRPIAGGIAVSVASLSMMAWAIFATPALAGGTESGTTTTTAGMSTTTEAGSSTTTKTATTNGSDASTTTKATTTAPTSTTGSVYTARDAGSACDENGHVIIQASIRNNSDTLSLTVTVTDITFAGESETAVVPPGQTHTFFLDAGPGPLPGGQVAYHVVWDGGQADFTRGHSPTDCPSGSTTITSTTSTTTPGGTTTSMTSTTSTTPTTVSGSTVTPPSSSSTTPLGTTVGGKTVSPGGTAFTGLENVVPLGAIALVLMTGGSGLLWAGARRRGDEGEDEE